MNQNSKTILRYAGRAIVAIAALAMAPATARAGFVGLVVTKSCPAAPVPSGSTFQCLFSVQNQDTENRVEDLVVTNTVPCSDPPTCTGGVTVAVACEQAGFPVTALEPFGSAADTCTGVVEETAPFCSGTLLFIDQIAAAGFIEIPGGAPIPVSGSVPNGVLVDCCPPDTDPIVCVITRLFRDIVLIKQEIILLPGELFPSPGNRQALLSGLDTVEHKLEDQKFDDAGKALDDLLKHLDGCASADGTPDRNDWINSCEEQTRIRSLIDELIADIGEI